MPFDIQPLAEAHVASLHLALDSVAREKRYLAFQQAPPREEAFAFYRGQIASGACHHVALRGNQVIGWCGILPTLGQSRAHVGELGMGVIATARGQGAGRLLIRSALDAAWARGFARIELIVRADNLPARSLYESEGFAAEGILRDAFMVDGQFFGCCMMALLKRDALIEHAKNHDRQTP
jgi:putative acetyltransferase